MDQGQRPEGRRIQAFDQDIDETTSIEPRELKKWDVVSLVVNKMIGTGIYYTPAQVLILIGSKWGALLVWVFGVIYTYVSVLVYLEYGTKWPYNGGEFTYVLKILPRPNLIFSTAYAYFFAALSSSGANSLIFAVYAVSNGRSSKSKEYTYKMTAFLLVLAISLVHLLLKGFGLDLNLFLAGFKTVLLAVACLIGFIGGFIKQGTGSGAGFRDFGDVDRSFGADAASVVIAMILVLYAFQGWENANYVTAEIAGTPEEQKKTLKSGVLTGVTIVSALYLFFNLVVFLILDFETIARYNDDISVFHGVFQRVFYATPADGNLIPEEFRATPTARAVAAFIAMSAAGNLIGTVYTNARVKREIARHQLVPFSSFFASSSHIGETQDEEGTPTGGLILNCITSWIMILVAPIYDDTTEGITFVVLIFTYGRSLMCALLGVMFYDLDRRAKEIDISQTDLKLPGTDVTSDEASDENSTIDHDNWAFRPLRYMWLRIFVGGILFAGMNGIIFGLPWSNRPTTGVTGKLRKIPIRYVCYITIGFYALGIIAALYIMIFAKQMVFWGPQGPLVRDPTSKKYRYPDTPRLPNPLAVLKRRQLESTTRVSVSPDDNDFRVQEGGYYVRKQDRRWIFLFDDLGLEKLFSVPWREKNRIIKAFIKNLFHREAWKNGRERVIRLWSRLRASGEAALPARVKRDLDRASHEYANVTPDGEADADGEEIQRVGLNGNRPQGRQIHAEV